MRDVIVAGGGTAGFIAAIAARNKVEPRNVGIKKLQELLAGQGVVLRL